MNKSRKQLNIEAVEKMIDLYDNPKPDHHYFESRSCFLCRINTCRSCFLVKGYNSPFYTNCTDYQSGKKTKEICTTNAYDVTHPEVIEAFKERADFYRKVLKIIKLAPVQKFTAKGFSEFTEIKLEW